MDMLRVTARWTGFTGAPGYSNFFFAGGGGLISDAGQVVERVRDAFSELPNVLPAGLDITVQGEVAVIDSDTGMITGYENVDDLRTGGNDIGGSYAGPAGAVVTWRTADLRNGRRIRGRTFLVPLALSSYEDDGSLDSSALSEIRAFGDVLTNWDFDSEFGVWSRPVNGSGGVFATVTNYTVADKVAVLRSRRD